jgi:subfamily B ATP-binding cassette protein MsbA
MMAMPLIQFASIGTQITEAFAGLDRIREVMDMKTEDDQDAFREPLPEVSGEIEFENVWFEYNEGVPCSRMFPSKPRPVQPLRSSVPAAQARAR